MSAAVSLAAAGFVAFAVRSSMVHVLHGRRIPAWLDRALTAAIPAGLAATVVVALVVRGDAGPARAGALALAGLAAGRTRSMLVVVGVGLAAIWALQALGAD
jgi:branched-subunit amino acid transport protein